MIGLPSAVPPLRWFILASLIILASGFSAAYFQWQILQAESQFPDHTPVPLAADNTYGVTIDLTQYDEQDLHQTLNDLQQIGFQWLRQPIDWAVIEPQRGDYHFQALDMVIDAAHLRGFKLIVVLQNSPPWARDAGTSPQTPPIEATDFGHFARIVARRYGQRVRTPRSGWDRGYVNHYQIWHEPNLSHNWGNRYVQPTHYTHLLKNAAITIRAENPQAKILTAALAPNTFAGPVHLNEVSFLKAMYEAGAAPWFDIVAGQLYGFHLPIEPLERNPQLLNIHRISYIRQTMLDHGDGHKPIWATAFGWNALPPDWAGQPSPWPTDIASKQARRTTEAIAYARTNWPWLGPMLAVRWDTQGLSEDDPERGFAITPDLLAPFAQAAQTQTQRATVGVYSARHSSGTYYGPWRQARVKVDNPQPETTLLGRPIYPTMTIAFEGTRLDLTINRGRFRGYLWVKIDGQPSTTLPRDEAGQSYIILYDPLMAPDTLTLARYLPDGPHIAQIQAEGGWGQWVIEGWQVYREADTRQLQLGLVLSVGFMALSGLILMSQIVRHRRRLWILLLKPWTWFEQKYALLGDSGQIIFAFVLLLTFWLLPSPWADLILPLMGIVFILRPDIGLMILSFGISFFLIQKDLILHRIFVHEVSVILMLFSTTVHLLLQWGHHSATNASQGQRSHLTYQFDIRATDWATLALLILATLNTLFFADHQGAALYELRTVIINSIVFYMMLRLVSTFKTSPTGHIQLFARPQFVKALIDAFILGAVVHAGSALFQYMVQPEQTITAQGVLRALGYLYGSPNNLALFLERIVPILMAVSLFGLGIRRKLYLVSLVIVGLAAYLTYSMGMLLLALPTAMMLMTLIKGDKRAWLGAGAGITLLGIALLPLSQTERFLNIFRFNSGSTVFFRIKLWESSLTMLSERPFTGVGLDNFLYHYRTRYILPTAWADPNLNHPHNLFLDYAVRLGLWGVLILLWLQWQFWSNAWRTYRRLNDPTLQAIVLGLMGSMSTFLMHGLVDNSYFLTDLAFTFFLSVGVMEIVTNE